MKRPDTPIPEKERENKLLLHESIPSLERTHKFRARHVNPMETVEFTGNTQVSALLERRKLEQLKKEK